MRYTVRSCGMKAIGTPSWAAMKGAKADKTTRTMNPYRRPDGAERIGNAKSLRMCRPSQGLARVRAGITHGTSHRLLLTRHDLVSVPCVPFYDVLFRVMALIDGDGVVVVDWM